MRKMIGLMLTIALLFMMSACTPAAQETVPASTTVPTVPDQMQTLPEPETQTERVAQILADNENCTFTMGAARFSDYAGLELEVTCINKTDKTLIFSWTDVSVCGYQYDPLWSQEVAPGQEVLSTVGLDTYQLERWGIPQVDEIRFTLNVFDSEDFMAEPYVDEICEVFPTGMTADTVSYPDRTPVEGEQVVLDQNGLKFIIESFEDTATEYTLHCYLENQTEQLLMFSWEDVTVNGTPVDPMWSEPVNAGMRAYAEISFPQSRLSGAGIDTVEEITFRLTALTDAGETLLDENFAFAPSDSAVG